MGWRGDLARLQPYPFFRRLYQEIFTGIPCIEFMMGIKPSITNVFYYITRKLQKVLDFMLGIQVVQFRGPNRYIASIGKKGSVPAQVWLFCLFQSQKGGFSQRFSGEEGVTDSYLLE
jgi:hypothetical protein